MTEPSAPLTPTEVAALLRAAGESVRAELTGLPWAAARWHPAPDEWCALEVIGHLIEAEQRGFAGRIRQILAEPEPRFQTWEQETVARARRDCEREPADVLAEFTRLREASVTLVASLKPADVGLGGHHPTVGYLRIGDLLHEWVHHDRNHLRQLLANVQAFAWPSMGNAQRFSRP